MSGYFKKSAALTALFLLLIGPVVAYKRDITTWNTTRCGVSKAKSVTFHFIEKGKLTQYLQRFCYELHCNTQEYGECACDTKLHDVEICMYDACFSATDYHSKFTPHSSRLLLVLRDYKCYY